MQGFDAEQGLQDEYIAVRNIPSVTPKRNGLIPGIDSKHDKSKKHSHGNKLYLQNVDDYLNDKRKEEEINSEWRDLANIMDRIFLILYALMTVIVTLSFLLQCAVQ